MTICTVTETAREHINNLCTQTPCYAVRLSLKGGGCAGFEYKWDTAQESDIKDSDTLISTGNGHLVIDEMSQPFVQDTVIDYVTEMLGTRMEIRNPNIKSSCGCGTSISF